MRLPLKTWHRETFAVQIFTRGSKDRRAELAKGWVSGPFGVYAGDLYHVGHETEGRKVYSLIHMPSQVVQFTLPRAGLCRQAAEELAACDLDWSSAWYMGVVGPIPEMEKARDIHNRWKSFGVRKSWGQAVKVAHFTVKATAGQSARWKRAAEAEGYASVGGWAAPALDAYLKQRLAAGAPVPLAWARGTVRAVLEDGNTHDLLGWIAPPFGFFPGRADSPRWRCHLFTLVYTPTGRVLATFRTAAHCKALASDLARLWVRWDGTGAEPPAQDPGPILQRFRREDV